ncbi:hypothetical protein FRB91_000425 [Serendipita sp. 411]|nr:hypothetical protein FRB91_000425 [Serendipita sp. 411]
MDHEDATDLATRVEDALKANESRKLALMEYIHNLEAHLASVDALIGSAEAHMDVPDDMESDEELPYVVSVPNAIPAVPPISASQLEDMSSPFYHACQRHRLYNDLTSARNWTETENAALKDAVQREGMRYHALQLQSQGYNALLSLENVPLESYGELKEHLDWDRIARYIPNRLPSMCKVQWLSNLHPGVRRGPWSEEERIDLLRAVREARISARNATRMDIDAIQTGESLVSNEDDARIDWEVVAGYMANGRIPIDCMKAYRAASERRIPTVWDSELDEALLQAVEKYGASNMTTVAMSMPISITRQQCMSRYEVLVDKRVSGKWSEEEDTRLKALLQEIPPETEGRWKIISERMKTRSERQCRAR